MGRKPKAEKIDVEVFEVELTQRKKIKKESQQQPGYFEKQGADEIIEPPYDLETLTNYYEENTWHYRCCNVKAQVVGGLGWQILPVKGDKGNESQKQLLTEKMEQLNPAESTEETINKFLIDFEALGNAYFEIVANRKGEIVEIYHVPAYTLRRLKDKAGFVQVRGGQKVGYFNSYFENFGNPIFPGKNYIAHFKNYYIPSSFYGMPDFLPALAAIDLDNLAANFNLDFFDNSAIPALAIIVEGGSLSSEAKKKVQEFLQSKIKGRGNFHKTLYIPTKTGVNVKFEKLMESIRDYSFRLMRHDNRDEIIAAHGVLPRMVGVMTAGQLGGTGEGYSQLKIFKELTIRPKKNRFEYFLNKIFKTGLAITDWKIQFNELDIESPQEKSDYVINLINAQVLTPDEGRAILGYDPLPEDQKTVNEMALLQQINKLIKVLENK